MILRISLIVKFRALGVTWGTLARVFDLALPPLQSYAGELLHFDERGVRLIVEAVTPTAIALAAEPASPNGRIHA